VRKWIFVGVVGLVVIVLAVSAFAGGGGEDEQQKPLVITAEVVRRDLRDEVTITGTLGRVEQRSINASAPATVSKVYVTDGAELQVGQAILALDGRDSVTENGDVSFFRKLDVGASGADVLQLEQILQAAGYSPGTVDQRYTEQTRAALAQWQGAHGYPSSSPQGEQSMTVALQQGTGYKIGKRSSAGVVIGPRAHARSVVGSTVRTRRATLDPPSVVPFSHCTGAGPDIAISGTASIAEGGSTIVTLTAEEPIVVPANVVLQVSGSATPGADFSVFSPVVTVPAGAAGTTATFAFTALSDTIAEPDEFAVISMVANATGEYCVGSSGSATITITNTGGAQPVVTLTPNTTRVTEGMPAQLTVGLDRALTVPLQIFLAFSGTAVEGTDYGLPPGLLVVPAGQTTLPVSVPTFDDATVEPDKTLTVELAASSGYTIGSPAGANLTLASEDVPEVQVIGGSNTSLGKGGAVVFQIVADQPPIVDTTIQYQAAGTAKPGVDVAPLTGTVLLRAGTTSTSVRLFALNTDVVFLPTDMIVAHWPTRVGSTLVKEGDIVTAGAPLFSITETGFTVTLKASAADRTKLEVGQTVTVTLQGGTSSAPGVITELDETATVEQETQQQSYQGKVQVQGELGAADGAPVVIDVVIQERLGVLTVPIAAVKQNGEGQDVVRVIDLAHGGTIEERRVETGLSEASYIEIKSGLNGDEVVVVEVD